MKNIFKITSNLAVVLVVLLMHPASSMDFTSKMIEALKPDLTRIYDKPVDSQEQVMQIYESFQRIDLVLQKWPKNEPVPIKLIKALGAAIGQFCYGSPYTLQVLEESIIPYLKSGLLTYQDCLTPHYDYKFGLREGLTRQSLSDDLLSPMKNGQVLVTRYHLNYPVLFNRFLSEFNGDYLLIGGGKICECEDVESRHPNHLFFSLDIDNAHQPDMVAHAGYLPHLFTFPTEKFGLIWFEHCTVPEFSLKQDTRVLEQYFRFSKPGAIFIYQTNFMLPDLMVRKIAEKGIVETVKMFEAHHFTILENKTLFAVRDDLLQEYKQIIAMKPFARQSGTLLVGEGPLAKIDSQNCLKPTVDQQQSALLQAKGIAKEQTFQLTFPLETILSWLPKK